MSGYQITIDVSGLVMGLDQVQADIAGKIHAAIGVAAQKVKEEWADRVMKEKGIWHVERTRYVQSLYWEYTGPFSAVVTTGYRVAQELETGRPARDLKRMLDSSMKVRVAESGKHKGQRYLIIPFRHNVPSSDGPSSYAKQMPGDIYSQAKALSPTIVKKGGHRESGTGAYNTKTKQKYLVPQKSYDWGGRLPAGMAPKLKPHHTTDIYAGMVRMKTGKKSSAYLTFRVMGAWQTNKWIVPAQPGRWIAKAVAESVQQEIGQTIEDLVTA